ncbi:MAG: hypothetical protein JWM88_1855 [Verrucomicrobia bacterium]|nr:hypothetical protein [Verrucomicrobiota bacterium]
MKPLMAILAMLALGAMAGCSKSSSPAAGEAKPAKHEHHPPHGGTPVVLGEEVYHLELVLDAAAGKVQAFILDGEMESFIRSSAPSFEVVATVEGRPQSLVFRAVANPATGETVGDSSLFEAQAGWLKATASFEAELKSLTIRGTTFTGVKFNFPKGNDRD